MSPGVLVWAWAGCSPRKTNANPGKLQMDLRWKTHGVGLSLFLNGCQISLITADILKGHSNLPPSWTAPAGASMSTGTPPVTGSNLTAGAHQLQTDKRKGKEVFLFTAINTQRAGILCVNRLLAAALGMSRSEEQTALDTANESLWAL